MMIPLFEKLPAFFSLLILVGMAAAISAGEAAIFSLSRKQLASLSGSGRWGSPLVVRLRDEPQTLLSTVLFVTTLINTLLYSLLAIVAVGFAGDSALSAIILGLIGFVLVVFVAKVVPRHVAQAYAERLAPFAAGPLRGLLIITMPLRWTAERVFAEPITRLFGPNPVDGSAVTSEELQELVSICQNEGLINDRENTIIHHVVELSGTRVSALMVPRVDFVAFDIDDEPGKLAELFRTSRLLHIPVYEGEIDNVFGLIDAKDYFLDRQRPLRERVRPVHFIPEQAPVEALLSHFRRSGTKMAIVVDEYGGLAGVVALEDVVEAIVGDLAVPEEPREGPLLERISDTVYLIDAGLDVDRFCRAFELPLEETRIDTVGGMFAEKLGHVPGHGAEVRFGHVVLRVVSMKKRRVIRVKVILDRPVEENPDLAILLGLSLQAPVEAKITKATAENRKGGAE